MPTPPGGLLSPRSPLKLNQLESRTASRSGSPAPLRPFDALSNKSESRNAGRSVSFRSVGTGTMLKRERKRERNDSMFLRSLFKKNCSCSACRVQTRELYNYLLTYIPARRYGAPRIEILAPWTRGEAPHRLLCTYVKFTIPTFRRR